MAPIDPSCGRVATAGLSSSARVRLPLGAPSPQSLRGFNSSRPRPATGHKPPPGGNIGAHEPPLSADLSPLGVRTVRPRVTRHIRPRAAGARPVYLIHYRGPSLGHTFRPNPPLPMHETLAKLREFDSPTICNVIELFDVRPRNAGYMDGRIRAAFAELPPMVGFATTAAFRSDAPPAGGDAYGSMEQQAEAFAALPGPAVVVFQDLDDPPVAATFGEVMCSVYQAFGSVGLITSGGGRDLLQVRALDYPVFTGSTIVSHAYCHILHIGLPVRVGGLVVNTGDLLHGDANGVTNIPLDIAAEVADVAGEFVHAERIILDYVRGPGEKKVAELVARRKEFSAVVKKLSQRVRRGQPGG
jgi:4-hydroxy-4-methyl-2-oxoglutarate aldolase